jgi:hypothetical protein
MRVSSSSMTSGSNEAPTSNAAQASIGSMGKQTEGLLEEMKKKAVEECC